MQYAQQSILEQIVAELDHAYNVKEFIDFSDQVPNQEMACEGSLYGNLATLDLSEASDRVSVLLVRSLLKNHPHLLGAVEASRSTRAGVLNQVIDLNKFASMGSALCFPFEAMVFLTIIFSVIAEELNTTVSQRLLKRLKGKVRVYGDDIIIPVEYVVPVISRLEAFGLKVNKGKSFWTGKFRESCGKEYYDGFDVSIVRVRRDLPTNRKHVPEVVSAVSLRNQLFKAGYFDTVEWLDQLIEKVIPFPIGEPTSPGLVRHAYTRPLAERTHQGLQHPLVRGVIYRETIPVDKLDSYGALMKFFLRRGEDPFEDKKHLERAGRAVSSTLQHGWFRPY